MTSQHNSQPGIRPWSVILLVLAVIGIYYFLPQLSEVGNTITALRRVNGWWFLVGILLMTGSFFVVTFVQYSAGGRIGSYKKLFVLQMRGMFANHFLPFSIGTITITSRYYGNLVSRTHANIIAALPTVGLIFSAILLLAVSSPDAISDLPTQLGIRSTRWIVPVILLAVICIFTALLLYWKKVRVFMNQITAMTSSKEDLQRFVQVLLGSLVVLCVYAGVLWASAQAADAHVSYLESLALYIIMWFAGSIIPTPGGIGTSEAALTFGLTSIGIHFSTAVVTMLTFRLISFWLPLLPGFVFVSQRFRFGRDS